MDTLIVALEAFLAGFIIATFACLVIYKTITDMRT